MGCYLHRQGPSWKAATASLTTGAGQTCAVGGERCGADGRTYFLGAEKSDDQFALAPSLSSAEFTQLSWRRAVHRPAHLKARATHLADGVNGMNYPHPAQTLVESFNALADEVQLLIDRKTILEHKLRFAHEQVCHGHFSQAPQSPTA